MSTIILQPAPKAGPANPQRRAFWSPTCASMAPIRCCWILTMRTGHSRGSFPKLFRSRSKKGLRTTSWSNGLSAAAH